jgi:hypothetical protein
VPVIESAGRSGLRKCRRAQAGAPLVGLDRVRRRLARAPVGEERGCRVQSLGVMRYIPVASKGYIKRYLPDGFTGHAVSAAPSLAWNRDDGLQDELVRKAFRRHVARLGDVPGQSRRSASARRVIRAGLRCAPRRTAVLAVLEVE